jgi:hypothetical protein
LSSVNFFLVPSISWNLALQPAKLALPERNGAKALRGCSKMCQAHFKIEEIPFKTGETF